MEFSHKSTANRLRTRGDFQCPLPLPQFSPKFVQGIELLLFLQ
jgi:hypothetical protein